MDCTACEGWGTTPVLGVFGRIIRYDKCPQCDGTGKATTSPASGPTAPDQANPPQDSQAHLRAILGALQAIDKAVADLRRQLANMGIP